MINRRVTEAVTRMKLFDNKLDEHDITTPDELYNIIHTINIDDYEQMQRQMVNEDFYNSFVEYVEMLCKFVKPFNRLYDTRYWIFDEVLLPKGILHELYMYFSHSYAETILNIMHKYMTPEEVEDTLHPKITPIKIKRRRPLK